MPFERPTLQQLINRSRTDIEAELKNGAALLRRSFESALARANAGLAHSLHGHIRWGSEQILPDSAEEEFLVRHASLWGIDRKPATKAELTLLVTGTDHNVPIPADTTFWQRADGVRFVVTDSTSTPPADPNEVLVAVRAVEAGSLANTIPGSELTIVSPITGVDSVALVQGEDMTPTGGGADVESIAALRDRLIAKMRNPPKGGGPGDYVAWALEVPGVTRAWELPLQLGPGTVLVLFVQDTFDPSGNYVDTILPDGAFVATVSDYIDAVKPVTAILTVAAPVALELFSGAGPHIALKPNTPSVQAQVILQLQDLLLRSATPGSVLPRSHIREAISIAPGEDDHDLLDPVGDVEASAAELIVLGTPVFTAL